MITASSPAISAEAREENRENKGLRIALLPDSPFAVAFESQKWIEAALAAVRMVRFDALFEKMFSNSARHLQ